MRSHDDAGYALVARRRRAPRGERRSSRARASCACGASGGRGVGAVVVRMISGSRVDSIRISRIPRDSVRLLIRAFDTEPLSSLQSARMAQELEAWVSAARAGFGPAGPRIIVTGPDGAAAVRRRDGWA